MPNYPLNMKVNGHERTLQVDGGATLAHVLREQLNLTGTKIGCSQGACGTCTVRIDGKAVLSCITPALRCEGKTVETIESVATYGELHPVQEHLVKSGGIQCGFCTPGVVMTTLAFLEGNPIPDRTEVQEALSGNLCRCTGYKKIIEAVENAARELAT